MDKEKTYEIAILKTGNNDGYYYSEDCLKDCAEQIEGFPLKGIRYLKPYKNDLPIKPPRGVCETQGYATNLHYEDGILKCHATLVDTWLISMLGILYKEKREFSDYFRIEIKAVGIADGNEIKLIKKIHSGFITII
ncbi:MAG: hypothetical protein GY861_22315 [bacterium]|nr:hypothetical protein [bacterium]